MVVDPDTGMVGQVPAVDGRRARAERNREAVVEAILSLLRDGVEHPGVEEIAERSGVSVRSVFRHFDDLESLYTTAIQVHLRQVGQLFELRTAEGTTDQRIAALVEHRARLYEDITPVRRAAERSRRTSPAIDETLRNSRRFLRAQLELCFRRELEQRSRTRRSDLLDAIEVATSWSSWDSLRCEHALSVSRAKRVLTVTLHALVDRR